MSLRVVCGVLVLVGGGALLWSLFASPPSTPVHRMPYQECDATRFSSPASGAFHLRLDRLHFGHPRHGMVDAGVGLVARADVVAGARGRVVARLLGSRWPVAQWQRGYGGARTRASHLPEGVVELARAELDVDALERVTLDLRADEVEGQDLVQLRLAGSSGRPAATTRLPFVEAYSPRAWVEAAASRGGSGPLGAGNATCFRVVPAGMGMVLAEQFWHAGEQPEDEALSWWWVVAFEPTPRS